MGDDDRSSPSKRQMLSEEQKIDIFSSLPEEILHYIVAFLSTKEVCKTSVLSKRWLYFWTSISTIKIDEDIPWGMQEPQRTTMGKTRMEAVDRILSLHDTSDIKKLKHRFFSVPVNFFRLNSWVRAVVKHNVQELKLCLTAKSQFRVPKWLYTCRSLVILNLRIPAIFKTPMKTALSNLKKLHLSLITFSDEVSLQVLLSSCPVLDELSLEDCELKHVKSITISLPTITTLTIQHCPQGGDMYHHQIKFSAVNLTRFDIVNDLYLNFHVCDLSSLNFASIDLMEKLDNLSEVADRITNIITGVCSVETLCITDAAIGCICIVMEIQELPTFYNLTHFEISTEFISHCCKLLMKFLEKTPKLEHLSFDEGFTSDTFTLELNLREEHVPSCFNSSLKKFSFYSFVAASAEVELLSFVLKYASKLEEVSVYCSFDFPERKVEDADKQLKMLPRTSEICVIELNTLNIDPSVSSPLWRFPSSPPR